MALGWYELNKSNDGRYKFVLKAANSEVILSSQMYQAKDSARNGIASVQTNCPLDERYNRQNSSDERFYFTLEAANYQVIGTSQMYTTSQSRDKGIESVKANGVSAEVRDRTGE
ncbi:MAG TPA: YegP family protein [Thermoanaerobaculia bacterium]|nr:YegP family protein [Thermoanaerobaculia bacterium]